MRDPKDDELDYLLSRGGLGTTQRERVLQNILAASRARPRQNQRRRYLWAAASVVAMAAAVVLFVRPRPLDPDAPAFRAKGNGDGAPIVELVCLGASRSACPRGSLIAFSVGASRETAFLTAYADPIGGGERIWYLSDALVGAVPDGEGARTPSRATRVGEEHAPGQYRVEVLLTRQPLSRRLPVSDGENVMARTTLDLRIVP